MNLSKKNELPDPELDELLAAWKAPPTPGHMRARLFPEQRVSWWRAVWSVSFRLPLPVALVLLLLVVFGAWRSITAPRIVIRTERVEVPVVKKEIVTETVYRDRIVRVPANTDQLQPVAELRPRIIRGQNAQN